MNGKLQIDSKVDKGSTFSCLIPVQIPMIEKPYLDDNESEVTNYSTTTKFNKHKEKKVNTHKQNKTNKPYILLVEDNAIIQKIGKIKLETLNCTIDTANTGKEALEMAMKNNYDLILMDIGLPDIDGVEVTQQLRQSKKSNCSLVPIVALTAHVDDSNKDHFLNIGMNEVLSKPLTKKNIQKVLTRFVSKKINS